MVDHAHRVIFTDQRKCAGTSIMTLSGARRNNPNGTPMEFRHRLAETRHVVLNLESFGYISWVADFHSSRLTEVCRP